MLKISVFELHVYQVPLNKCVVYMAKEVVGIGWN